MIFLLSLYYEQEPPKTGVGFKAHLLHNMLKNANDRIIISSSKFYNFLRCLREDVNQLDEYYKSETIMNVYYFRTQCLHIIDFSTKLYTARLIAKQITE